MKRNSVILIPALNPDKELIQYIQELKRNGLGEGKYDENGKLIEDSWKNVYTMQDWEDELRIEGYTYVYLYSVTPAFENDFKELFQSEIKEKTLYQISEDGDSVILKKV